METQEQYQAALSQAEDKDAFILKYGDGNSLPSQAEVDNTTIVDNTNTQAQPIIDPNVPLDFELPKTAERATAEELDSYAKYQMEIEDASFDGRLKNVIQQKQEQNAVRDPNGEMIIGLDGKPVQGEMSNIESMDNSIRNMVTSFQVGVKDIDRGTAEIWRKLIGADGIDEYAKQEAAGETILGGWEHMTAREQEKVRREKEILEASMGDTKGIVDSWEDGDVAGIAAGMFNGLTSIGSSAAINTLTLGAGLPLQFFGQYYDDYNGAKAEAEGKSLAELQEDGDDDFWAPAAFGVLAGASEKFGLEKFSKLIGPQIKSKIGRQIANRFIAGQGEGVTELLQTGLEAANIAMATGTKEEAAVAMKDAMFSAEGLESYLQGMVGGAGMAGKGQDHAANVKQARKVMNGMRAPVDAKRIETLIGKEADLKKQLIDTKDPQVKESINAQLKEINSELKHIIPKANGIVRKMTDDQISKAETKVDAARALVEQSNTLKEKFQDGKLTQKEYDTAYDGIKMQFNKKKAELEAIANKAEGQPNQREKDGVTPAANGIWNTTVKQKIDKVIGEKGAAGAWDVIQSKDFNKFLGSKIAAVWNKIPSDIRDTTTLQDVIEEVKFGGTVPQSQTVVGTFKAYKAEGKAAPSSYFLSNIDNKITGAIQALTQQEGSQGTKGGRVSGGTVNLDSETAPQLADESSETAPVSTKRKSALGQAERLGVGAAFTDSIKDKMETLVGTELPNPSDKKFESSYVQRFRDHLAKPVREAMGKKKDYEAWLTKHAPELIDVYSNRTLSKKRNDPAYAWIDKKPSVQEFLDYHLPTQEDGKPHSDRAKKQTRLAEAIAEGIGFRAMEETIESQAGNKVLEGFDKVIETLKKLQGERGTLQSNPLGVPVGILLGAVVAAKKLVQGGMAINDALKQVHEGIKEHISRSQFVKYVQGQVDKASDVKSWADQRSELEKQQMQESAETVNEALNPGTALDHDFDPNSFQASKTEGDVQAQWHDINEIVKNLFPGTVFERTKEKFVEDSKADLLKSAEAGDLAPWIIEALQFGNFGRAKDKTTGERINKPRPGGIYFNKKDPEYVALLEAANKNYKGKSYNPKRVTVKTEGVMPVGSKEQEKINMDALEAFGQFIQDGLASGMKPATAALLVHNAYRATTGLIKIAAPIKYRSLKGTPHPKDGIIFREEHTMPASVVGAYILQMAKDGNIGTKFKNIRKNFYQILLSGGDDAKIDAAKLAAKMPKGWRMSDNVLARYFNSLVDIDPNSIVDANGRSIAQEYGAAVSNLAAKRIGAEFAVPSGKRMGAEFGIPSGKRNAAGGFEFNPLNPTKVEIVQDAVTEFKELNPGISLNNVRGFVKEHYGDKYVKLVKSPELNEYQKSKLEHVRATASDLREVNPGIEEDVVRGYVKDIHGQEVIDQVIDQQKHVVSEMVQDRFESLIDNIIGGIESLTGPKGALQANLAAVPLHIVVGGLRAAKLAYKGSRNLVKATEAGYKQVKDFMTRQEWGNFMSKAVTAVKDKETGKQVGLKWVSENAVEVQRSADLDEEFNQIIEDVSEGKISKDSKLDSLDVGGAKRLGFFRKLFGAPNAEDFKGLIYTILPKGKKGDSALKWFEDTVMKPYQRGAAAHQAYKANLHEKFRLASKLAGTGALNKTVPGTGFSWNNAVRTYMAELNGQETPGLSSENKQKLLEAMAANPKMTAYADKINEAFNGNYEFKETNFNGHLGGELASTADQKVRAEFLKEYQENADKIFSPENLNKIEAHAGKEVRMQLEETLQRMKTGKNRSISTDAATNAFMDWMNNATAMIMFINLKSAALQMLSTMNYLNTDGNNIFTAGKHFANRKQFKEDMKTLWNSDYSQGRRKGGGFDIAADEIADGFSSATGFSSLLKKIRDAGFAPTKYVDSYATTFMGATYYRTRLEAYKAEGNPNPEQAAMDDWVALTEESQQSADPSKISKIQAGPLGRVIFAFGNTPFQYTRIAKRAVSDLAAGRGNKFAHLRRIMWYPALQSVLFSFLQNALWQDDDDDEKKDWALLSSISSFLKSLGGYGAALSLLPSIISELPKGHRADWGRVATGISPPLSKKLQQFGQTMKHVANEEYGTAVVKGTELVANVPAYRAIQLIEQGQDAVSGDLSVGDSFFRALGWSRWALDYDPEGGRKRKTRNKRKRKKRGKRGSGSKWSPFDRGEMGQAFNDGTIEVDPNLSPLERKKTIAHEEHHVKQMEEDGLDYDDHSISFQGQKYARKDGKIEYNGKWLKEGDQSLPWESEAYAAESPLKRTDKKPKPGTPEWEATVQAGKDFNKDWYSNPVAAEKFKEQAPRFKGGASDRFKTIDDTHFKEGNASGAEAEYWRNNYADEEAGEHKHNVEINPNAHLTEGLVAHESSHAAGYDYDLGKVTKGILGDGARKDQWGRYINNPDEQYANLQQIRQELGLRPDQRDLTPAQLEELAAKKGSDDTKAYIKNFGADKVSKAHNTVAENKPKMKKSLKDLYSNKFNNTRNA